MMPEVLEEQEYENLHRPNENMAQSKLWIINVLYI